MTDKLQDKKQWVSPTVIELDIAERTQFGDGLINDGIDPSRGGGGTPGNPDS